MNDLSAANSPSRAHGCRFPFASFLHVSSIKCLRSKVSFADSTKSTKSRRSSEVKLLQVALAFESAPSALYSGIGTTAKQQGRLFPEASRDGMLSIRRFRVSACFAESIHAMKSLRAMSVRDFHLASDGVSSALSKSGGVFVSAGLVIVPKKNIQLFIVFLACRSSFVWRFACFTTFCVVRSNGRAS